MAKARQKEAIPLWSPRHPKNAAETKRVMDLIARDAADYLRLAELQADPSRRANGTIPPRIYDRPASRDWSIVADKSAPDAKRKYIPGPGPDHPLTRALRKGRISSAQYRDANEYRIICLSALEPPCGRDSTQAMMVDGGRANYEAAIGVGVADRQSLEELRRIHASVGKESATMLFLACYLGQEVGEVVRIATPRMPDQGVWPRFNEALDALSHALHPQARARCA